MVSNFYIKVKAESTKYISQNISPKIYLSKYIFHYFIVKEKRTYAVTIRYKTDLPRTSKDSKQCRGSLKSIL